MPPDVRVLAVIACALAAGCAAPDTGSLTQVLAPDGVSAPARRAAPGGDPAPGSPPGPPGPPGRTPAAAAAAAGLVAGMPAVVPIPRGARVTASAVQARPGRPDLLGVSVAGTSRSSTEALLAFFRTELRRAGFTATDDSLLPAGTSGAAFGRGSHELLLVAVVDRGRERSWSVGGTVEVRSARKE